MAGLAGEAAEISELCFLFYSFFSSLPDVLPKPVLSRPPPPPITAAALLDPIIKQVLQSLYTLDTQRSLFILPWRATTQLSQNPDTISEDT